MNKNFLSLALVAAFSVSFVAVASEKDDKKDDKKVDTKVEVKVSDIPAPVQKMESDLADTIKELEEKVKTVETDLKKEEEKKAKLDKGEKDEAIDSNITKLTKELSDIQAEVAVYKEAQKAANQYFVSKYSKSLLNKVTAPARYVANLVANNNKVALLLEVTGVAGLSYVIYKSFFAQEEVDEDTL